MRPLAIRGSWLFTPTAHEDERGVFFEAFTQESFRKAVGHTLDVQQSNVSISSAGTLRGIHFAEVPPGQAKYVQCYSGRIMDVVVDIRVSSPTFGQWTSVELDATTRQTIYIGEGLGHAFCALTESTVVGYMCSAPFTPQREHGVNPLDPELQIDWPSNVNLRLSRKDAGAPTLAEALNMGTLPAYADCLTRFNTMKNK